METQGAGSNCLSSGRSYCSRYGEVSVKLARWKYRVLLCSVLALVLLLAWGTRGELFYRAWTSPDLEKISISFGSWRLTVGTLGFAGILGMKGNGMPFLIRATSKEHPVDIRKAALVAIGSRGGPEAGAVLLASVCDEEFAIRSMAIGLLKQPRFAAAVLQPATLPLRSDTECAKVMTALQRYHEARCAGRIVLPDEIAPY